MKAVIRRIALTALAAVLLLLSSCSDSSSALDPDNPVTVTVWNYYNGDQLAAFERLTEEFNATTGIEKGIVIVSVNSGNINTLAEALIDSVNGKAGARACPSLAAVYAETGYILNESGALASFDSYFTAEELEAYVPEFLNEGRFNDKNELLLFPVSKSTEVFTVNKTDWQSFADATGITLDQITTQEALVEAAARYYEWTDSLTPDVSEDGKALYGRDSMANYIYIGCCQLGQEIFSVSDGKLTVNMNRDAFKVLWDNYYIPYINGYFGAYANFRSEDAKTGKLLSLTSSTTGVSYLPTEVTLEDDSTHPIEIEIRAPLPFADAVEATCVQQGAGYCLLKSSEAEQEGAVEFIKWFTESSRNIDFAIMSGYLPVTKAANSREAVEAALKDDGAGEKSKNILEALYVSADIFSSNKTYASKPFDGSKDVRSLLDSAMQDIADADRAAVVAAINSGSSRAEAVAQFSTEEYFDAWFDKLCSDVMAVIGQ